MMGAVMKRTELKVDFCFPVGGFCPFRNNEYEYCNFYERHIPSDPMEMPIKKPEFCLVKNILIEEDEG